MRTRNDLSIYERAAPEWWSGKRRWLRLLENLVPARLAHFDPLVGSWAGKRVLDLGCGGGFMSEALCARGAVVTGVDPSNAALDAARAHAKANGHAIDYRQGRGEEVPVADGTMDAVVCVDVLEHVEDLDRTLSEIARVLVPGGLLLYDTVNRNALATFVMITLGEDVLRLVPRGTHDPALFLRPADLSARLTRAGLDPGPVRGLGPTGLTRCLDLRFGPVRPTLVQYLGHATKRAASPAGTIQPGQREPPCLPPRTP